MLSLPSELAISSIAPQKDLGSEIVKNAGKAVYCSNLVIGKTPVCLRLKGFLTTNGVTVSDYGQHSIGFHFAEESEMDAFAKLMEVFDNDGFKVIDSEWSIKDIIKNDRIYLKLKTKNDKYTTRSNIKLDPKKAADAPLFRNQNVEVHLELNAYFGLEDKSCGLYCTVFNLIFEKA